jgi:hypothetical protein
MTESSMFKVVFIHITIPYVWLYVKHVFPLDLFIFAPGDGPASQGTHDSKRWARPEILTPRALGDRAEVLRQVWAIAPSCNFTQMT